MPLRFLTGEKKTGKTSFILEEMKTEIEKGNHVIYIVPEQMVFRAESYILDRLGEQRAFLIETLSFSKLASSILKKRADLKLLKLLDTCSKKLILHKIMGRFKEKLSVYGAASTSPKMIDMLSENITEWKKYCIDGEKISQILEEENLSVPLRRKLQDLNVILEEYEKEIHSIYQDHDDMLTYACREIEAGAVLNAHVYIDGFVGFTLQEMQAVCGLMNRGNHVTIAMMMTPGEDYYYGKRFYTTYLTKQKLESLAKENNISVSEIKQTNQFIEKEDICFLAENLLRDDYKQFTKQPEHIRMTAFSSLCDECEGIAADILKNARKNGLRFSEMAVILPDLEQYRPFIEKSFGSRGIAYYLDGKEDIVRLPIVRLISNLLEICERKQYRELYLFYLKSGFFFPEEYDKVLRFENFVLENGIRPFELAGEKAFEKALNRVSLFYQIKDRVIIEEVFKKVFYPLDCLAGEINRKGPASEKSSHIYEFLKEAGIEQFFDRVSRKQKKEGKEVAAMQTIQAYNAVCHALEKTALVLGDEVVSFCDYKEILKEAIRDEAVATIPLGFDSVMVTGLGRLKSNEYKVIYVAGLNDGVIPGSFTAEGLINETDRVELSRFGIELSKGNLLKVADEYTEIYEVFSSPQEQLVLSYPLAGKGGEALKPSSLIEEVKVIFPALSVEKEKKELAFIPKGELLDRASIELCELQNGGLLSVFLKDEAFHFAAEEAFSNYFHKKEPEVVDEKLVKKLYPNQLETSVSRLEKYRSCHFAYFMDYMLRASDIEELRPDPLSMGSMLHSIIEQFSRTAKRIGYDKIDAVFISSEVEKITEKLLKDPKNSAYTLNNQNAYAVKKLKRVAARTLMNIKNHFEKSAFTPLGFELTFGKNDKELKGITLSLDNGCEVNLSGVIDRADCAGEFVRVIDYKSSGKELNLSDIYHGISLQLSVYLATLLKQNPDYRPGSMTYLAADDPIISIKSMGEAQMVEEEIRSRFMMKGILLKDKTVLSMMDKELELLGKSKVVDVALKKDGDFQAVKEKNMLTLGEFQLILNRAVDMAKQLASGIYEGKTDARPVKCGDTDGCRFCNYGHLCGYDSERDTPDELIKLSKEEILETLRKGGDEE